MLYFCEVWHFLIKRHFMQKGNEVVEICLTFSERMKQPEIKTRSLIIDRVSETYVTTDKCVTIPTEKFEQVVPRHKFINGDMPVLKLICYCKPESTERFTEVIKQSFVDAVRLQEQRLNNIKKLAFKPKSKRYVR